VTSAQPAAERKFFFAYARKDSDFVLRLAADLRAAGVDLWLDQFDVHGGQRWDLAVEQALKNCDALIAVLSPDSMASQNVMDEVSYALDEKKLVLPILLRPGEMPFRLRRLQYVDFTESYDTGLAQLLRTVALPGPGPVPRSRRPVIRRGPVPLVLGTVVAAVGSTLLWKLSVRDLSEGFRAAIEDVGPGFRSNVLILGTLTGAVCGLNAKRWRAALIGAMAGALFAAISQLPEAKEGWSVAAAMYATSGALAGAIASGRRWPAIAAIAAFVLAQLNDRLQWYSSALISVASAAPLGAIVALLLAAWRDAQRKKAGA
jgi:hypothetical protein